MIFNSLITAIVNFKGGPQWPSREGTAQTATAVCPKTMWRPTLSQCAPGNPIRPNPHPIAAWKCKNLEDCVLCLIKILLVVPQNYWLHQSYPILLKLLATLLWFAWTKLPKAKDWSVNYVSSLSKIDWSFLVAPPPSGQVWIFQCWWFCQR